MVKASRIQLGLVFDEKPIASPMPTDVPEIFKCAEFAPERDGVRGEAGRQHLVRVLNGFRFRHGIYDVFRDFCELAACTLSNAVDRRHWDEREAQYMRVIGKYSKDEANAFAECFHALIQALDGLGPRDVLGEVFMQLEISNKAAGQFFTPQCISDLLGSITIDSSIEGMIKQQGYVTLQEPAVGGGSTVFGICKAMAARGLDYTKQLHVTAIDIDSRCAHMAYVQMAMLGIPAVVYHGDTLRMQMRSAWVTPVHVWDGWFLRPAIGRLTTGKGMEAQS